MTEKKALNQRRLQLIQKDVQIGFGKFLILFLVFCLVSSTMAFVFFFKLLQVENIIDSELLASYLQSNLAQIILIFTLPFIFCVPMVIYFFIRFTHRVCGPIYRCHESIKNILAGEAGVQIKIRKNDYYQDFADDLNLLIEKTK
jgi:hypothetical protein